MLGYAGGLPHIVHENMHSPQATAVRPGTTWDDLKRSGTIWDDVRRSGTTWDELETLNFEADEPAEAFDCRKAQYVTVSSV